MSSNVQKKDYGHGYLESEEEFLSGEELKKIIKNYNPSNDERRAVAADKLKYDRGYKTGAKIRGLFGQKESTPAYAPKKNIANADKSSFKDDLKRAALTGLTTYAVLQAKDKKLKEIFKTPPLTENCIMVQYNPNIKKAIVRPVCRKCGAVSPKEIIMLPPRADFKRTEQKQVCHCEKCRTTFEAKLYREGAL